MRSFLFVTGLLLPAPASAQADTAPPAAVTVSGGATLTSDYRFRGLSRSDEGPAVQGTVTVNHASGAYLGAWASSIDGSVPPLQGPGGAEMDLYGGYSRTFASGVGVDAGLLYYLFPGKQRGRATDFFEPYGSVSYTIGPVAAKAGLAYAWGGQRALDLTRGRDDSLYTFVEASAGVPTTPITLKAHLGRTKGALGRVNPTSADDDYTDWSATAEYVRGPFRAGVSYVDTDVSNRRVTGIGRFADRFGRDATLLGYVGFSF